MRLLLTTLQGIDQCVSCIDPKSPKFQEYINKVKALLQQMIEFPNNPGECKLIGRVRDFIMAQIGFDIGDEGTRMVWLGMCEGVQVCSPFGVVSFHFFMFFKRYDRFFRIL